LLLATPLRAQNVAGTWELTSEGPRGPRTTTVIFVQEGASVSGKVQMPAMGGRPGGNPPPNAPAGPREIEFKDGTLESGKLTFTVTMGMGERSFSQTYTATVAADGKTMEGTMTGGRAGAEPVPFKGVKK
jgi:hypothetical protein